MAHWTWRSRGCLLSVSKKLQQMWYRRLYRVQVSLAPSTVVNPHLTAGFAFLLRNGFAAQNRVSPRVSTFPWVCPFFLLRLSLTSDFGLWKVLLQLSFTHDLFQSLERLALTDSTVAAYLYRFSLLNIMSKWLHIRGKRSQTHQFKVYSHTTVDCHYNRCDCRRPSIWFRHLQALPDHQEEAGWGRATPMRAKHYETDHGERKWAWTSSRYF